MYHPFNCPHCSKIIPDYVLKGESKKTAVTCPECGSQRNCRNGLRRTKNGRVQTYQCQDCGSRFS